MKVIYERLFRKGSSFRGKDIFENYLALEMIVENSYSRVDVRKLAAAGVKRFFQL